MFAGRLDAAGSGRLWRPTLAAATEPAPALVFDLSAVELCDTAGAALLLAAEAAHGAPATVEGQSEQVRALLDRVRRVEPAGPPPPSPAAPTFGDTARDGLEAAANGIAFLGEALVALVTAPSRRRMLRLPDLLRYADQAGVRALPLVVMLGYLFGLILAFQSSVAMRAFGAELYVANLVAISVLRELGPLLASVILAGRTGSAFAAEIGTMKVNEEISALQTMGLDPMTMLVLPRLAAAMIAMPVMTLVLEVAALLGMLTVMVGFGFPATAIAVQVREAATTSDLYGGLFKAIFFGAAVAAIGCRAGLATGNGPRAVGQSATAAVVGGIVSTVLLDGLFAVLFYRLGL